MGGMINQSDKEKIKSKEIQELFTEFENCKNKTDEGIEYWYARDLQNLLDYKAWREFNVLIDKAKEVCQNAGIRIEDHFVLHHKMVDLGSGSQRKIDDYILDRYACYLIAMNGSSSKEKISFAQTYFATQTRKLEIIEERFRERERLEAREKLKKSEAELSAIVYERGFKEKDFGIMRSKGDEALFGMPTREMKIKLGVKDNRPLADFADTVIIKAKDLAASMTAYNTKEKDLYGVASITIEHIDNNTSVRETLESRGIIPSEVPPKEDINKVARRLEKEDKISHEELSKNKIEILDNDKLNSENIEISISNDLWKYALYVMYKKEFGIVSMKELYNEIPKIIPIPKEYMEKSETRNNETKFKQIIRNLKSNRKNKNNFINLRYAHIVDKGFQITPKGIEFVRKYFNEYI